jgi:branched-chain amino acid transport system permease protein
MFATGARSSVLERLWPLFVLIVGMVLLVGIISSFGNSELDRTLIEALIRLVIVIGLYIFVGNSGVLSFGHVGFTAIAAYAVAWQTCCFAIKPLRFPGLPDFIVHVSVPLLPAALISGLLAMATALIVGLLLMRLSGLAASIGTFCFLAIVNIVYNNWESVTRGTSAVVGIPTYVNSWNALAWVVVALVVAYGYQISSFGLSLRAAREDEVAAKAAGVNVFRQRMLAFVISAFFAGIGGVLYAHFIGSLIVNEFYLDLTFITIAMLVAGGLNSLAGAVVGVVTLSALIELLRQFEKGIVMGSLTLSLPNGGQEIGLGVVMLLTLILRPAGIMGNQEFWFPQHRDGQISTDSHIRSNDWKDEK